MIMNLSSAASISSSPRTICRIGAAPACVVRPALTSSHRQQLPSPFSGTALRSAAVASSRRRAAAAQAAGKDITAFLWQVDGKDVACPLCKSLRLVLNEKTLSYDVEGVDYGNKPDWLSKAGGMPAIKLVPEDKLIGGLNEIVNALEKKYVEPSIGKVGDPSSPSATNKAELDDLWESFQKSQTGGDPKNMTPKIEKVDKIIQGLGGKFFGQQIVDVNDLILSPRLYHMRVMLKKQGAWPTSVKATETYLDNITKLPSWQTMQPSDADVEAFWSKHAGKC